MQNEQFYFRIIFYYSLSWRKLFRFYCRENTDWKYLGGVKNFNVKEITKRFQPASSLSVQQVFLCEGFELCEGFPFSPCSPTNPASWALPLMISAVLCQGVSRASVSFGTSFGLESLLSSERTKPVSVGTQAKLIILVRCLAEQVRPG